MDKEINFKDALLKVMKEGKPDTNKGFDRKGMDEILDTIDPEVLGEEIGMFQQSRDLLKAYRTILDGCKDFSNALNKRTKWMVDRKNIKDIDLLEASSAANDAMSAFTNDFLAVFPKVEVDMMETRMKRMGVAPGKLKKLIDPDNTLK